MSATSLRDLKPGDRVQVFDVNGSRMGQPKGGWDGEVVKVGRKLITVQYSRNRTVFRLETGSANDDYGHQHIKTVEQAAEDHRRWDLIQRLRNGGVELRREHELATQTLEALVNVLEQAVALGVCVDGED